MNDARRKKVAYYGGTFDPVHCGHLAVARTLIDLFALDRFVFLPAFHAPHKPDSKPANAYHRFAMLSLATAEMRKAEVSSLELEKRESRYTFDTLTELRSEHRGERIFFIMGADSWQDILTWHRSEEVLQLSNHIVVSRPGFEITLDHVSETIRSRVTDLRGLDGSRIRDTIDRGGEEERIYITDAVRVDISATDIREDIGDEGVLDRTDEVPPEVAKYIDKYELYR